MSDPKPASTPKPAPESPKAAKIRRADERALDIAAADVRREMLVARARAEARARRSPY